MSADPESEKSLSGYGIATGVGFVCFLAFQIHAYPRASAAKISAAAVPDFPPGSRVNK